MEIKAINGKRLGPEHGCDFDKRLGFDCHELLFIMGDFNCYAVSSNLMSYS